MLSLRHPLPSPRVLLAIALIGAAATVLAACGGGSSSPTQPPTTPAGITFAEGGSAGSNTAFLTDAASASATQLNLEFRANQMDHVRGFAFDLEYPTNLLTFQGADLGSFLGPAANVELLVAEPTPGVLVVGVSRIGANRAVLSGSGLVATFRFTSAGAGSGPIDFSNESATRELGQETAVEWIGGTVTVTP